MPTMPRREFKVLPASDAPWGTEIVTSTPAGRLSKGTCPLGERFHDRLNAPSLLAPDRSPPHR